MALSGLRVAGIARRVFDGRQPDGQPQRRQPVAGGLVRADDVLVALQDARACAARLLENGPGHRGTSDHAAHRAACEAPLIGRGPVASCARAVPSEAWVIIPDRSNASII